MMALRLMTLVFTATSVAAAALNLASLATNQASATQMTALVAPHRPAVRSVTASKQSGDYRRSGQLSMQMGGLPGHHEFNDWDPHNAFHRAQRRAQRNPHTHHPEPPWAGYQPPPQGMPGWAPPPAYGQPQNGMPRMGGPPPGYGRPSSQDMPGMGRPPFGYDQQDMPGMHPPPGRRRPFRPTSAMKGFEQAWVLVFNEGKANEDVCVDRSQSDRPPSVLAFENMHDADEFAQILQADGLEGATPLRWGADQLESFCQHSGLEAVFVPRGQLPTPGGNAHRGDPERKYPGDGSGRPDAYTAHRPKLEELLYRTPDNCGDDDCTGPEDEPEESPYLDGTTPLERLRREAIAAIDATLMTYNSTMDLTTLMKSVWETAQADARDKESAEEEEEE